MCSGMYGILRVYARMIRACMHACTFACLYMHSCLHGWIHMYVHVNCVAAVARHRARGWTCGRVRPCYFRAAEVLSECAAVGCPGLSSVAVHVAHHSRRHHRFTPQLHGRQRALYLYSCHGVVTRQRNA